MRGPPAAMRLTPLEWMQDAMGVQGLVIAVYFVRMLRRVMQDEMRGQLFEITKESRRVGPLWPQEASAVGGPDP